MNRIDQMSPSTDILNKKIIQFFLETFDRVPFIPSFQGGLKFQGTSKILDIVLVGHVLELLKYIEMPPQVVEIKLWCLSVAHGKLVSHFTGIPLQSIAIIPRYELFPVKTSPRNFPGVEESCTIVLASRWLVAKNNIHAVAKAIKLKETLPQKVTIIHSFPTEIDVKQAQSEMLRHGLDRGQLSLTHLGPDWALQLQDKYSNPIFLNLSQDYTEDFGVSLAQAESLGWPTLLSAWGAHLDVYASKKVLLRGDEDLHFLQTSMTLLRDESRTFSEPESVEFKSIKVNLSAQDWKELLFSKNQIFDNKQSVIRSILSGNDDLQ